MAKSRGKELMPEKGKKVKEKQLLAYCMVTS